MALDAPSISSAPARLQTNSVICSSAGHNRAKLITTDPSVAPTVDETTPLESGPQVAPDSMRLRLPHLSGALPLPLFLVQLWLLDWERQQRISQVTLPLPLRNPSSYCFFSSSLHALASLRSVVDLAHNLAFLRLLQKNLELDEVITFKKKLSVAEAGGLAHHRTASHAVASRILSTEGALPGRSSEQALIKECFPVSLYRCLLALNRGRIKGSFCRALSAYAACACTGLGPLARLGTSWEPGSNIIPASYPENYGGSFLDLLCELAAGSGVRTEKESYTSAKGASAVVCPDELGNDGLSHDHSAVVGRLSYNETSKAGSLAVVGAGGEVRDRWSTLGSAVASSVEALEDEWRLSRFLHSTSSGPYCSRVVAMYRELVRAIPSAESPTYPSAFSSFLEDASLLHGPHVRTQDTHEFLQLLIEGTERECETAEQLQQRVKAYLEEYSALDRGLDVNHHVIQEYRPRTCSASTENTQRCRERAPSAATTPRGDVYACSPHGVREGASSKGRHFICNQRGEKSSSSLEFLSYNGSLWNLVSQNQLKSVFVGTLQESMRCLRCGVCSPERSTPFWCIHVTLSGDATTDKDSSVKSSPTVTLEQLLDAALGPQRLEGVECTSCSALATLAYLRRLLWASPLLASVRMHGRAGPCATEAVGDAEESLRDAPSIAGAEMPSQLDYEKQVMLSASRFSASQRAGCDAEREGQADCDHLILQGCPAGPTTNEEATGAQTAVDENGVWTKAFDLDNVPGLFSPFWYLPASLVSAWVRIWILLSRLRRYLMSLGPASGCATPKESTWNSTGGVRSVCQQTVCHGAAAGETHHEPELWICTGEDKSGRELRGSWLTSQNAVPWDSSTPTEFQHPAETGEALRLAAGDAWVVEYSAKEKLQRIGRLPSVLIIQVNTLKLTRTGQVRKEQKHCVFPFLLDATSLTQSTRLSNRESRVNAGGQAELLATDQKPIHYMCGGIHDNRGRCENADERSASEMAPSSELLAGTGTATYARTETTVSDIRHRECWCGLNHLYELRAVITHTGTSTYAGHFACYRRWDAHAFIPGAAWYVFIRQFLSSISPATQSGSDSGSLGGTHVDVKTLPVVNDCKGSSKEGGWHQSRHRVRQWLLHAARKGCTKSSFAWISDDCVRPASFSEVQAAQPYMLFYEKVSPSVF